MKREILICLTIIIGLGLVVVFNTGTQPQAETPTYNYIQEQEATGGYGAPVLHQTLDQIGSVFVG